MKEQNRIHDILLWMKGEVVLCVAITLGVISSFFVHPCKGYFHYIDFRVLVLLLCLMLVVAGLKKLGVFRILGEKLCGKFQSTRGLSLAFVLLCFVTSMLITNDVALITFVPFSISVFAMIGQKDKLISLVVFETIAANLGSMLTPIGNPQNLLLFSISQMPVMEFVLHMLPMTLLSLFFVVLFTVFMKNETIQKVDGMEETKISSYPLLWFYIALFFVCLGNVFHLYSHWIVLGIVVLAILLIDRKLFGQVDYSLLFTFIGFFVFIGNMKQLEAVNQFLSQTIVGNELLVGVVASQFISNVPAAMLLSGFTTDYKALLYGVNLGGLGTLIASMASLISYRFFIKEIPEQKKAYFLKFSAYNFGLLIVLYIILIIIQNYAK